MILDIHIWYDIHELYDEYLQDSDAGATVNIYHEKFLMWRFQKVNYVSVSLVPSRSSSVSSVVRSLPAAQAGEWHVR
jgi:hypothetical protein